MIVNKYTKGSGGSIDPSVLEGYYTSGETDERISSAYTILDEHTSEVEQVTASALTELHDDILELSARTAGIFPNMPFFDLDGSNIDQIKSAIFDDDGAPISNIWLLDTAFNWVDNSVDWADDVDILPYFTIDPEEKVAYIENIPAGNYVFGLYKDGAGENYGNFDVKYWSKDEGDWAGYTVDDSTHDIWDNPVLAVDDYWRNKFAGGVVLSNNGEWFNWSFPKDVERFEIRIVDDGEGHERLEINTTYKDYQEQIDALDERVTILEVSGGTPSVDLSGYYTSAQTQDAIDLVANEAFSAISETQQVAAAGLNQLEGRIDELSGNTPDMSLYTPTSGFSTINGSAITTGGDIVIEGGGVDLSAYYTSAQTEDAISAATAGKADAANVTPNDYMCFPKWNEQGVITGTTGNNLNITTPFINGIPYKLVKERTSGDIPSFYAPANAGTAGDILVSAGLNQPPIWSAVTIPDMSEYYTSAQTNTAISAATQNMVTSTSIDTIWQGTQEEYDAATQSGATANPTTFYIIKKTNNQ